MTSEEISQETSNEAFKVSDQIQSDLDKFLSIEINHQQSNEIEIEIEQIIKLTQITQCIANHLRDLSLRDSIGQTSIIPHTLNLLNTLINQSTIKPSNEIIEAIKQLMRVIGNLVHTHNINRAKSLSHQATQTFKNLINLSYFTDLTNLLNHPSNQPNSHCLQIIITVLFNLCFEYVPAHMDYIEVGLIKLLSALVEHIGEIDDEIPLLAIRLLDEIFSTDEAKQIMPIEILQGVLSPIFFIQSNDSNSLKISQTDRSGLIESLSISTSILESITEVSKPIQKAIRTIPISRNNPIKRTSSNQTSYDPVELSNTVVGRLLWFVRFDELPLGWLDQQAAEEEEEESFLKVMSRCKTSVARSLMNVMNGMEKDQEGDEWFIRVLVSWLSESELVQKRPDLITTIGLLLGNLACSDFNSIKLIQHYGVLQPLVKAFRTWSGGNENGNENQPPVLDSSTPGEQVQVLHSLIGLARNLAVAEENKEVLGDSGLIELAIECLSEKYDVVQPLIGLSLGFLRHVCKRNLSNVLKLISGPTAMGLERMIGVKKRLEQGFIKLEVMRLMASSIPIIYSDSQSIELKSKLMLTDLKKRFSSMDVMECLIDLLRIGIESNLLFVNEALVSMTILACRFHSAWGLVGLLLKDHQLIKKEEEEGKEEEEVCRNRRSGMDLVLMCWLGIKKATKNQGLNGEEEKEEDENENENRSNQEIQDLKLQRNEEVMKFNQIIQMNSRILIESLMKTLKNGPSSLNHEKENGGENQVVVESNVVEKSLEEGEDYLVRLDLIKDSLKALDCEKMSDDVRNGLDELLMI